VFVGINALVAAIAYLVVVGKIERGGAQAFLLIRSDQSGSANFPRRQSRHLCFGGDRC
jgi:hypothetical protein